MPAPPWPPVPPRVARADSGYGMLRAGEKSTQPAKPESSPRNRHRHGHTGKPWSTRFPRESPVAPRLSQGMLSACGGRHAQRQAFRSPRAVSRVARPHFPRAFSRVAFRRPRAAPPVLRHPGDGPLLRAGPTPVCLRPSGALARTPKPTTPQPRPLVLLRRATCAGPRPTSVDPAHLACSACPGSPPGGEPPCGSAASGLRDRAQSVTSSGTPPATPPLCSSSPCSTDRTTSSRQSRSAVVLPTVPLPSRHRSAAAADRDGPPVHCKPPCRFALPFPRQTAFHNSLHRVGPGRRARPRIPVKPGFSAESSRPPRKGPSRIAHKERSRFAPCDCTRGKPACGRLRCVAT